VLSRLARQRVRFRPLWEQPIDDLARILAHQLGQSLGVGVIFPGRVFQFAVAARVPDLFLQRQQLGLRRGSVVHEPSPLGCRQRGQIRGITEVEEAVLGHGRVIEHPVQDLQLGY
jgi:hypothetical protein